MKKYLSFFRIRFVNGLQYRTAAYAGIVTQFAWGFMEIFIFSAFYKSNPTASPMKMEELSSYIWLQQAFLSIFMTWFFDNDIFDSITGGNVAYEMCRPMDIYSMWFTKNVAIRCAKTLLRCFPILLVAFFLPPQFRLWLPQSVGTAVFFLISLLLGLFVLVAFGMLIYISTFYTISPMGVRILAASTLDFFTGAVIPIPLFPEWLQPVLNLLPFGSMQNAPLRIYSGNIGGIQAVQMIGIQIFWLVTLVLIGKVWMKKALKRVIVQGG